MACYDVLHKEALKVLTELFSGGEAGASMAAAALGKPTSELFTKVIYPGVVEGKADAVIAARVSDLARMGHTQFDPYKGSYLVQPEASRQLLALGVVLVTCNKASGGFGIGFLLVAGLGLWWLFKKR